MWNDYNVLSLLYIFMLEKMLNNGLTEKQLM